MKKKPVPLRDLRGAAEVAARDYADRHRAHDRFIETRVMAAGDQQSWKVVALVEDPNHVTEVSMGAFFISLPTFPREWKDHDVVVRKRK